MVYRTKIWYIARPDSRACICRRALWHFPYDGYYWQKHREVIAAARRTVAAPGSIELVDLATHQITATQRPAVNLLVDNRQTATVELGLSVVFTISALIAGIRGGRLVAVHSGRCNVTATLAVRDTKVISR